MSHQIKFHGADPFKCHFCGKEFNTWNLCFRHEREHKGVLSSKIFSCDIAGCAKIFKSMRALDYHKTSVQHVGRTNASICGQCGKGFNNATNLRVHVNSAHTTERKLVCEGCGERFKLVKHLRRHMLVHTGEKPFQCDICQQKFRHREVLKRHLEGHQKKGADFKPRGSMKHVRKRVNPQ